MTRPPSKMADIKQHRTSIKKKMLKISSETKPILNFEANMSWVVHFQNYVRRHLSLFNMAATSRRRFKANMAWMILRWLLPY